MEPFHAEEAMFAQSRFLGSERILGGFMAQRIKEKPHG